MRKDRQLLVLTHLSQLIDFVTVIGGFIIPFIIWVTKKDEVADMDQHGKAIMNFRISMFLYILLCIPMILFFGLGLIGLFVLGIFYLIFPITNAIKASNGEAPDYPLSIQFIS